MKKLNLILLSLIILSSTLQAQTPAFPGAAGGGKFVTGGRGGKVLYVTSLADDGSTGTLRWAINQTGTRTILFKVSGTIALTSALKINNGNVTIAGQTAPGDGITLKNYEMNINSNNIIVRYMRFRLGNEIITNESDAFWGRYKSDIMIDHCSMSWSIDETASFYSNKNFTMQWCIISESLNNAGHSKGAHGYGGLWGGKDASFHHNLLAHHNSRNPRFNGWKRSGLSYTNPQDEERLDFRNNVIYNWGDNSSYGGEAAGKYNLVNNYFKYGPGTKSTIRYKITQVDIDASSTYQPRFGTYYISGNYVYGSTTNTNNNWSGVSYATGVDKTTCVASSPFDYEDVPTHEAETAFERVLEYAGASLTKDAIDIRISTEARNGTATYKGSVTGRAGIIDTQNDVGGWPVLMQGIAPTDTDADGIPDGWLNSNYPGKTSTELHESGYTYLEMYLNSLVQEITTNQYIGASTTAIEPLFSEQGIQVHTLRNTIELHASENIQQINVFDLTGRILAQKIVNLQSFNLDLNQLPKGIKIIQIQFNQGKITHLKVN